MPSIAKLAIAGFVACCLSVGLAQQKVERVSTAERRHILDGEFKIISTTDGIPANIKQAFSQLSGQRSFAMANPGQKFQVGDVIVNRNLPFRRLVFAGAADDRWFIHYERGGRGHSYYVIVFKVGSDNKPELFWDGSGGSGAKSLEQLRKNDC